MYNGKKIITRSEPLVIPANSPSRLTMEEIGYTKSKFNALVKSYYHKESHDAAIQMWKKRLEKGHGSVGFHCFNHYIKGGSIDSKRSRIASIMGPCIQAVTLTIEKDGARADLFYRSTELGKKFPADLVFVDQFLFNGFDFSDVPLKEYRFHFCNITFAGPFYIVPLSMFDDPVKQLRRLKKADPKMWRVCTRWTGYYICEEFIGPVLKYAQGMRVKMWADKWVKGRKRRELQEYCRSEFEHFDRVDRR
jgi:hypothetical protein